MSGPSRRTPRTWSDPLILFFVLGGLGLLAGRTWIRSPDTIRDDHGDLARSLAELEARLNRPPTAEERAPIVEAWTRREVLYREAVRLELGRQDPVVKTQLVRSMTHLLRSTAPEREPSKDALDAFIAAQPDRYGQPARWSLEVVRAAPDGVAVARGDIEALRSRLEVDGLDAVSLADVTTHRNRSRRAIEREYSPAFAAQIAGAPHNVWRTAPPDDPRWVVRVVGHTPAAAAADEASRARAREDWIRRQEAAHVERAIKQRAAAYTVDLTPVTAEVD